VKRENMRIVLLPAVCLLLCFGGVSCKKKSGPVSIPKENPGNLHVRVRNTGSRTLSNVVLKNGEKESKACELAPSAETEHVFYRLDFIKPLFLSYQDDKGELQTRAIGELYKKMPKTPMKGNFDLTFYINSNTDEVVMLTTDED
jgi:hypothetical protein